MQMLSDDDLNLRDMTRDELDAAWDLWFDLAQSTNDADPPYSHGVLTAVDRGERRPTSHQAVEPGTPARPHRP